MRLVVIAIGGNETDCIPNGVPCRWIRTNRMGSSWYCKLFSREDSQGNLEELKDERGILGGPGRLQRHRDCLLVDKGEV